MRRKWVLGVGLAALVGGSAAGQQFELLDVPDSAHAMHRHDPGLYARTIAGWEV